MLSLNLDIKIAISLQYGKSLSIVCFSFVLKKNDSLPKYVNGTMLRWTIERDLPYCKLKVLFRSKCRLNTLFQFKDPLEKKNCSGIIYLCTCSNCKVTYFGKAFHHFYNRVVEYMGISSLTGKLLKNVKKSAISDHLLQCNCAITFDEYFSYGW